MKTLNKTNVFQFYISFISYLFNPEKYLHTNGQFFKKKQKFNVFCITNNHIMSFLKRYLFYLLCITPVALGSCTQEKVPTQPVIVIHGGAGYITKESFTTEKEQHYTLALKQALDTGYAILEKGGSSVDAVEAAIRIMEDNPLFNAGKGSVLTNQKTIEMDASIMDGATGMAGGVAGVTIVKNPITAARAVMEQTPHVLIVGKGADSFAMKTGLTIVSPEYFYVNEYEIVYNNLGPHMHNGSTSNLLKDPDKFGTVGCVALDQYGNLAAGTSTGGMSKKLPGRVGDSPLIGSGTYASNATCAVSATGHGEYFIRQVVAYDIAALIDYTGCSITEAVNIVLDKLEKKNGVGGVIALDNKGNFAMQCNTPGMYRAYKKSDGSSDILFFKD